MTQPHSAALGAARILIGIARVLNVMAGIALVAAIPASFLFEPVFFDFFSTRPARIDPSWLMPTLRVWFVLAVPMIFAVHFVLTRLLAVVRTVGEGDPFVPENAARLKTIAWCMLGAELLGLSYGLPAAMMNAAGSSIPWEFSLNGWLAVALMFVLAQVFEEGTRIRTDLGAMI